MSAAAHTFTSGLARSLAKATATSSLRDFMAAQAMTGLVANGEIYSSHHELARDAYAIADAMLLERRRSVRS